MVDEINPQVNQSSFHENQLVMQAPPIDPNYNPKTSRNRLFIIGGIALFLLMIVTLILATPNAKVEVVVPTPRPSPTPTPPLNLMKQELKKLELQVTDSNPNDVLVVPPQVDMEVDF